MGLETDGVVGERAKRAARVSKYHRTSRAWGMAGDEKRADDVEMFNAGCHLLENSVVVIPQGRL